MNGLTNDERKMSWRDSSRAGFKGQNNRYDSGSGLGRSKKVKKRNKSHNVDVLKNNEEYSHLVKSTKLTVFDWDRTIVFRNLPAQVDAVIKLVRKKLGDISIQKFCPIKKTFKGKACVTLACVLNNKADFVNAINNLSNFKVGDYDIIVSRFVKPHSFISNAFAACILNFPDDASEKILSEILKDCGVIHALDVEYSENGAVKKALVNFTNSSDLASLLNKDGTQVDSAARIKVVPIKASCSIIVGNVHQKVSNYKLGQIFGENVLLVQRMPHMICQIFFKDEESAEKALSRDGETIKDLVISVQLWSKKKSRHFQVFVHLTGNQDQKSSVNINKLFGECGKLWSVIPIKKKKLFSLNFESKEGQRAALQLNGSVINGVTLEVTKKHPSAGKVDERQAHSEAPNANSKSNHVHFE